MAKSPKLKPSIAKRSTARRIPASQSKFESTPFTGSPNCVTSMRSALFLAFSLLGDRKMGGVFDKFIDSVPTVVNLVMKGHTSIYRKVAFYVIFMEILLVGGLFLMIYFHFGRKDSAARKPLNENQQLNLINTIMPELNQMKSRLKTLLLADDLSPTTLNEISHDILLQTKHIADLAKAQTRLPTNSASVAPPQTFRHVCHQDALFCMRCTPSTSRRSAALSRRS